MFHKRVSCIFLLVLLLVFATNCKPLLPQNVEFIILSRSLMTEATAKAVMGSFMSSMVEISGHNLLTAATH